MKKLLLLCLVLLGGVMQVDAKTKRIFVNQQISGWKSNINTYGLNLFLEKNSSPITAGWPGNAMTKISDDWFYIDIDSEESGVTACLICPVTNNYWYVGSDYRVNINLSDNNVIYLYENDSKAKMASGTFTGYVIANSSLTKLADLTQDGLELTGTIDFSGESSNVNFAVFPTFTSGTSYVWDVALRPESSSDFELSAFQKYTDNTEYGGYEKTWKEMQQMKYSVSFNMSNNKFTITPYFTRTIKSHGYSTFASDYDVAIPSGVTASYATGVENNELVMTNFTDGIPANTGALLYKAGGGEVTFTPASTTDVVSGNLFVRGEGTAIAQSADGKTNYILTTPSGKTVGFYKANSDKSNTVAITKAYLAIPNGNSAREFFVLDGGETTSINAIENGQLKIDNNAPMYNLAGQRVNKSYKGVVIVNGKKMLNK